MGSRAPGQKCTRWGGSAPTRGRVPDGGQSARWEAVHLDRTAPDGKQSATRGCAPGQKCTRWGVEHPMGSSTPDGEQYTWTERVQCTPIGCRALANKHKRGAVAAGWTVCGACWGRRRAWAIDVDRGACGDDGRPAAPTPAPGGSRCVWGDASVGHRRGSWRSLCVSRRPRPCRCRDGCRETRAPGEPGRWPLRR